MVEKVESFPQKYMSLRKLNPERRDSSKMKDKRKTAEDNVILAKRWREENGRQREREKRYRENCI